MIPVTTAAITATVGTTSRTATAGSANGKPSAVPAARTAFTTARAVPACSANTARPAASGARDASGGLGVPGMPGVPATARSSADPGRPPAGETLTRAAVRVAAHPLGPLCMVTVTGSPGAVEPAPLAASAPGAVADHLVVAVHGRGAASFVRDGELLACGPHDVVVLDATTPFTFHEADDFVLHLIGVPRRLLGADPAVIDRLSGVHPHGRGSIASLLGPLLEDVATTARELPPRAAEHLAGGFTGLLRALATESETSGEASDTPPDRHPLASRLRAYVNERLGDRDLTPGGIAAHHHISTRLLHKLFAADGITVSGWIRQRRLEECRRELSGARTGRPHPPVASTAKRWGFPNAAHFSRSFRTAYGVSPTAWRDLHVSSVPMRHGREGRHGAGGDAR